MGRPRQHCDAPSSHRGPALNVSDAEQEANAGVCAERESVARGPHIPQWTRERDGAVGCIVSSRVVGMTTEPP